MNEVEATGKLFETCAFFFFFSFLNKGPTVNVGKCCPRLLTCVAVAELQRDVSKLLKASFPQVVTSCVFLIYWT